MTMNAGFLIQRLWAVKPKMQFMDISLFLTVRIYYLLYSWIMWHIHIWYTYTIYIYICISQFISVLYTDTFVFHEEPMHFHFVLGLRVLLVEFNVDYVSSLGWSWLFGQVFHVKQKTTGRSYAMKVLHKAGILAFPGKVFDVRWVYAKRFWKLLSWGVFQDVAAWTYEH